MIPVIISGGSGTRLWPVSRHEYPKQFCEFFEESLFNKAIKRLQPMGVPWVITTHDLRTLTTRAIKDLALPEDQVLYEPMGRNTGPAIAALCRLFELRGLQNEVVGVFPADHLIENDDAFRDCVRTAEEFAMQDQIVTLGIQPTYPATGYGYIETVGPISGRTTALKAKGFKEKPNETTARDFLARGNYFWNAGMFIFHVAEMIKRLNRHAPEIWGPIAKWNGEQGSLGAIYSDVPKLSIDYAVMEKLNEHVCVPCKFGWTDLGTWDAVAMMRKAQSSALGSVVEIESRENFVSPHREKSYALIGVKDLIVVDTEDALLISKRGETEKVKTAVDELKSRMEKSATHHQFEIRPWGRFDILRDTGAFKAKTICVDAGAQLSYQSHKKRAEHWIFVRGAGDVILNDETLKVTPGTHVFIPVGAKHRVRNPGTEPLEFVEVQLGSYFGEDDITRYQDDYWRK